MVQIKFCARFACAVVGMGLALMASTANTVWADPAPTPACSVPVCDISAALAALRGGSENTRFQTIRNFRNNYKNSPDTAVLANLADFAKQAEGVMNELYPAQDTDHAYMAAEAIALYSEMLIGLSKYSDLNASVIAGYYQQLSGESTRYPILLYWKDRIQSFEDKDSLLQLVDLFGRMERISRASGDPDYIASGAKSYQDLITARLAQLYPYFEGSYRVRITCDGGAADSAPTYCTDGFINRLIVMDTMSPNTGLQISLANSQTSTMMYTFPNAVISGGGSVFEGSGSSTGVLSSLHLTLDRAAGKISGFIRNSDSLSTVRIEGELDATPASVYDLQARSPKQDPLVADQIVGVYKGQYGGRSVTFSIVPFAAGQLSGMMAFAGESTFKLRFQSSLFYPKTGVLVLLSTTATGSRVKLTLLLTRESNGYSIQGFGFSDMSGATQTLVLKSAALN